MSMQWHKRILSNFSLDLEDQIASSYQGCILSASVKKWIGYFPSERQWWQGGKEKRKKKKKASFNFHGWTSLGESLFEALSYPVLLQPESQASPGQGSDPQAGWGVTASWRSNLWELGPWAGWGMLTSWDLDWQIPEQVKAWEPFEDPIPRQVKACWLPGTPRLELGIPKVSSMTSVG